MNSASIRFIHRDQLESGGYGECFKRLRLQAVARARVTFERLKGTSEICRPNP
jgi:hypothetical protein